VAKGVRKPKKRHASVLNETSWRTRIRARAVVELFSDQGIAVHYLNVSCRY